MNYHPASAIGLLALFLVGAGCNNSQQDIISSQRTQIDELTKKVDELTETVKGTDGGNKVEEQQVEKQKPPEVAPVAPKPEPTMKPVVDPQIKIEKCRAEAKDYADGLAKKAYLSAYQTAMDNGNTETALYLLNLSAKPEHPADYDGNYDSAYLRCLDN